MRAVRSEIMLGQPLSDFIRRHANNGVLTRIEILRELEKLHADGPLLEASARPAERVLDDVLQELPASLAGTECSAG